MANKGTIKIHLAKMLTESGLSKNKFCQRAELQRGQLNSYLRNSITRLDIDHTLDCSIADLLEYDKNAKHGDFRTYEKRKKENS